MRDSLPIDMLVSAVSVLAVAQSSSEIPEGLMNNPVRNSMLTSSVRLRPAVHADRSVPKEEVSHTSDNSYHLGVSHVGFP